MNFRAKSTFTPQPFAGLEELLTPRLIAAVQDGCDAVLAEAQAICPVQTGELRDSGQDTVKWEGQRVDGYVQFTAAHAGFVEFGTGVHGNGTYPYDLPQSGVPITGDWVYDYKGQDWQGHAAQPFLRPALDTARPVIIGAFQRQGFRV